MPIIGQRLDFCKKQIIFVNKINVKDVHLFIVFLFNRESIVHSVKKYPQMLIFIYVSTYALSWDIFVQFKITVILVWCITCQFSFRKSVSVISQTVCLAWILKLLKFCKHNQYFLYCRWWYLEFRTGLL
jgi:hypothetical protein